VRQPKVTLSALNGSALQYAKFRHSHSEGNEDTCASHQSSESKSQRGLALTLTMATKILR